MQRYVAKKKVIKLDYEPSMTVLGVASNDKVWKVCWKINQQLGLNLSSSEEGMARLTGPELYRDEESDSDFEYLFFENTFQSRKVPPLARQFRFWLAIKAKRDEEPSVEEVLRQLQEIDAVSLARDLSQEKDIKKLVP